jgi:GNAT superfamily N-acetyltransferase
MGVRIETQISIEHVVDAVLIGKELHEESEYRDIPFDPVRAVSIASQVNVPGSQLIGAVAVDDTDGVIGYIFGKIEPYYFSDELAVYDLGLFIRKHKRGTYAAVRLVKEFERLAKQRGCKRVYLGIATGINPERTGELYERLGYATVGTNTVKRI